MPGKKQENPNDVVRRAVFTRALIRRRGAKNIKKRRERIAQAIQAGDEKVLRDMRKNPHKYTRYYGLHSLKFKLISYMYKMRGYHIHNEAPGPLDILWSCAGCFAGIFILMWLDRIIFTGDQLLLLGSFGASSLIIFGSPHSVFAQPRSVVCGQVISAFVGVTVFLLLGDYPLIAAPLGVSLAFAAMQLTKTMHPPGGATALIAVSGHPVVQQMGYGYTLLPVGAGILILFILGIFVNNISRNRLYPIRWW